MLTHKNRLRLIGLTVLGSFIALVVLNVLSIELDPTITGALGTGFIGGLAALADAWRVRDRVIDDPEVLRRVSKRPPALPEQPEGEENINA